MKYIAFFCLLLLAACNNENKQDEQPAVSDSVPAKPDTTPADIVPDSVKLYRLSDTILVLLKNQDLKGLFAHIHPDKGLRFSPYGFIDTTGSQHFTASTFAAAKIADTYNWGDFDGSGDPIRMSIGAYLKRFVFNADYTQAPQQSFNNFIGRGNSLNNLRQIYPSAVFTEYYFPGFDKKFEGMDWTCLRLVFERYQGQFRLVALVHDEWTI